MSNEKILMKEWDKLTYHDPELVLKGFRDIEPFFIQHAPNDKIKHLRTQKLRPHHEGREAALFCHGLASLIGSKVYFARHEAMDYDIVTMFKSGDELHFAPVQLKELVPEDLNPTATFEVELKKLEKYTDSKGLIVAFHLNRKGQFDLSKLSIPKLGISQLWVFGAETADREKWFLIGDLLKEPQKISFSYPH